MLGWARTATERHGRVLFELLNACRYCEVLQVAVRLISMLGMLCITCNDIHVQAIVGVQVKQRRTTAPRASDVAVQVVSVAVSSTCPCNLGMTEGPSVPKTCCLTSSDIFKQRRVPYLHS